MRVSSLFFGPRPSVPSWAALFFGLFVAGFAGYAQLSASPELPTVALGYVALGVEFLVRALVLAELARVLLTIYRDGSVSWPTKLSTGAAVLACLSILASTTFQPGPHSFLLSAVCAGAWLLAHRYINGRLAELAAIATRSQPTWMQALGAELERDRARNYRGQH